MRRQLVLTLLIYLPTLTAVYISPSLARIAGDLRGQRIADFAPPQLIGFDLEALARQVADRGRAMALTWESATSELVLPFSAARVELYPVTTHGRVTHLLAEATPVASLVSDVRDVARRRSFEAAQAYHPEHAGRSAPPEPPLRQPA